MDGWRDGWMDGSVAALAGGEQKKTRAFLSGARPVLVSVLTVNSVFSVSV